MLPVTGIVVMEIVSWLKGLKCVCAVLDMSWMNLAHACLVNIKIKDLYNFRDRSKTHCLCSTIL